MAFLIDNWVRVSASAAEPTNVLSNGTTKIGGPRIYSYITADSQATVAASGYFGNSTTPRVSGDIVTGDVVMVNSTTDGTVVWYTLTNSNSYTSIPYGGTITSTAFSNSSSTGVSQYAGGSLTLAQMTSLYSVGVQLLAAPGAGLAYLIDKFELNLVYGSAAYTGGGVLAPQYGSTVHAGGTTATSSTVAAATLTGLAANELVGLTGLTASTASSLMINEPLWLVNATADFATGTGGSATWAMWYRTVSAV